MQRNNIEKIGETIKCQKKIEEDNYQIMYAQGTASTQASIGKYIGHHIVYTKSGEAIYYNFPKHSHNKKKKTHNTNLFGRQVYLSHYEPVFVNTQPNASFSYLNPKDWFNWGSQVLLWGVNEFLGVKAYRRNATPQDHSINNYAIDFAKTNFGQEADIERQYQIYLDWKQQNHSNKKLVLWGYSGGCGAATGILKQYLCEEVALVVLEGCFYSVEHNLKQFLHSPIAEMVHWGLTLFTNYRKDGTAPCDNLDRYPKKIPFLFITSDNDRIIHPKSSEALAKALAERGENPVYFLKLKHANHHSYPTSTKEDRKLIQEITHALFERYNLKPYIHKYAERGRNLLEKYRIDKMDDEFQNNNANTNHAGI